MAAFKISLVKALKEMWSYNVSLELDKGLIRGLGHPHAPLQCSLSRLDQERRK
jgi:hypothetical protein